MNNKTTILRCVHSFDKFQIFKWKHNTFRDQNGYSKSVSTSKLVLYIASKLFKMTLLQSRIEFPNYLKWPCYKFICVLPPLFKIYGSATASWWSIMNRESPTLNGEMLMCQVWVKILNWMQEWMLSKI
jgi:hypothetical protein